MPFYNWTITFAGEGVEAVSEEAVKKALANQATISANVAGSLKAIRIEVEPASGLIMPAGSAPDLRKH
jgi:hypothetical protein